MYLQNYTKYNNKFNQIFTNFYNIESSKLRKDFSLIYSFIFFNKLSNLDIIISDNIIKFNLKKKKSINSFFVLNIKQFNSFNIFIFIKNFFLFYSLFIFLPISKQKILSLDFFYKKIFDYFDIKKYIKQHFFKNVKHLKQNQFSNCLSYKIANILVHNVYDRFTYNLFNFIFENKFFIVQLFFYFFSVFYIRRTLRGLNFITNFFYYFSFFFKLRTQRFPFLFFNFFKTFLHNGISKLFFINQITFYRFLHFNFRYTLKLYSNNFFSYVRNQFVLPQVIKCIKKDFVKVYNLKYIHFYNLLLHNFIQRSPKKPFNFIFSKDNLLAHLTKTLKKNIFVYFFFFKIKLKLTTKKFDYINNRVYLFNDKYFKKIRNTSVVIFNLKKSNIFLKKHIRYSFFRMKNLFFMIKKYFKIFKNNFSFFFNLNLNEQYRWISSLQSKKYLYVFHCFQFLFPRVSVELPEMCLRLYFFFPLFRQLGDDVVDLLLDKLGISELILKNMVLSKSLNYINKTTNSKFDFIPAGELNNIVYQQISEYDGRFSDSLQSLLKQLTPNKLLIDAFTAFIKKLKMEFDFFKNNSDKSGISALFNKFINRPHNITLQRFDTPRILKNLRIPIKYVNNPGFSLNLKKHLNKLLTRYFKANGLQKRFLGYRDVPFLSKQKKQKNPYVRKGIITLNNKLSTIKFLNKFIGLRKEDCIIPPKNLDALDKKFKLRQLYSYFNINRLHLLLSIKTNTDAFFADLSFKTPYLKYRRRLLRTIKRFKTKEPSVSHFNLNSLYYNIQKKHIRRGVKMPSVRSIKDITIAMFIYSSILERNAPNYERRRKLAFEKFKDHIGPKGRFYKYIKNVPDWRKYSRSPIDKRLKFFNPFSYLTYTPHRLTKNRVISNLKLLEFFLKNKFMVVRLVIKLTLNNFFVTLTTDEGKILAKLSMGFVKVKKKKKSKAFIYKTLILHAINIFKTQFLNNSKIKYSFVIVFNGMYSRIFSRFFRLFNESNVSILYVSYKLKLSHNGCKFKKRPYKFIKGRLY